MTTRKDISTWFDRGIKQNAMFMFVICDTFDWEDYPVYAISIEGAKEKYARYPYDMQKIMEVYDLRRDKMTQINKSPYNLAEII